MNALNGGCTLRAVLWPSSNDKLFRKTGSDLFYYHKPHDHNFNFLTVGYFGPGYISDYYGYYNNERPKSLAPGNSVELIPLGRRQLENGKVMYYRSCIDIHSQLPPEAASVSLNILDGSAGEKSTPQYIFDGEGKRVDSVAQRSCSPAFFNLAASIGGEECIDMLRRVSEVSTDDYTKFSAFRAMAIGSPKYHGLELLKRARRDNKSESVRSWIDAYLSSV